ncbi:MAG: TIM barrel protein, partial [Oscillospiraceae bacterium]
NKPQPEEADFDCAVNAFQRICDYAGDKAVTVLIETNGMLAKSSVMADFIRKTNRENCGVLWDIHHPFRFFGESPKTTFDNIGQYVKYVHVKDSLMENGRVKYKMMGQGDVPVSKALKLLKDNGYSSFVTLEWVKRWCPDLEDAGIVFSHFSNYISNIAEL